MFKELFRFLNKIGKGVSNLDVAKSNSNLIYNDLKKGLDTKYLPYIVERVKGLLWSFVISDDLVIYIANESLKGRRAEDIANDVPKEFPSISLANAKALASTVSSIQSSQITRLGAEGAGLDWYVWRTAQDGGVRPSHRHMEGVLVRWTDVPSPEALAGRISLGQYHAGECRECRCYAQPLVNIDYIKSPLRVYYNEKINRMARSRFKELCPGL